MTEDLRCCGTGTCLINEQGYCWCGQKWNGEKMCFPGTDALDADGKLPAQELDGESGD